jgi:hypothetical protein
MGQTADQLRQEIESKRGDAASKIDQIEARVTDTAQQAKETVDQTVQSALGTVTETVDHAREAVADTVEQVKQSIDLKKMAEERPLVALGAALVGGFVLGGLTGGGDDRNRGGGQHYQSPQGQSYQYGGSQAGRASGFRGAAQQSGLDETISLISGTLMGMITERLRLTVKESFPEFEARMRQHGEQQQQRQPLAGVQTQGQPQSWNDAGQDASHQTTTGRADFDASQAHSQQGAGTSTGIGSSAGASAASRAPGMTGETSGRVSYYGAEGGESRPQR